MKAAHRAAMSLFYIKLLKSVHPGVENSWIPPRVVQENEAPKGPHAGSRVHEHVAASIPIKSAPTLHEVNWKPPGPTPRAPSVSIETASIKTESTEHLAPNLVVRRGPKRFPAPPTVTSHPRHANPTFPGHVSNNGQVTSAEMAGGRMVGRALQPQRSRSGSKSKRLPQALLIMLSSVKNGKTLSKRKLKISEKNPSSEKSLLKIPSSLSFDARAFAKQTKRTLA